MRKTIVSLALASIFASSGVFAVDAVNDGSSTALNFSGNVTASLCQISTADSTGVDINLGEVQAATLTANGASKPQTFTVNLTNCDSTINAINYKVTSQNPGDTAYISPQASDSAAKGVGVYLTTADAASPTAITLGTNYTSTVTTIPGGTTASPDQKITLQAYMKKAGSAQITPGSVNAIGYITVKAAAPAD